MQEEYNESSLLDDIDNIHDMLKRKDLARETSIKKVRILIRTSGDGIRGYHRSDIKAAEKCVKEANQHLTDLFEELSDHPDLLTSNAVKAAMTEFTELMVVRKLLTKMEIPSLKEVGVPPVAYLNGLGDAIGEIRRHILNLLREHETELAEEYLGIAEKMYDALMTFDYPKAIVGSLRRKQDIARSLLEKSRADVTNAVLQSDLSEKLDKRMD